MATTFEGAVQEVVDYFLTSWYSVNEYKECRPAVERVIHRTIEKYGIDNVHLYMEMKEFMSDY